MYYFLLRNIAVALLLSKKVSTLLSKFANREHVAKNQLENVIRPQPSVREEVLENLWIHITLLWLI